MTLAAGEVNVTAADLAAELDRGTAPLVIVDVRAASEVRRWRAEGDRDVPRIEKEYWDVLGTPEVLLPDIPDGSVAVVICAYGNTSEIVADELRAAGVDARNLAGGMVAWSRLHVAHPIPADAPLYVVQLDRVAKGCLSYVVGVEGGAAIVVDPDRFSDDHLTVVDQHGSRVAAVVDTHLHADHVSGAAELAGSQGVPYVLTDDDGAAIEHDRPADGAPIVDVEGFSARVIALHAPGHTPGSLGVLVADRFLLSGDTLFVEGIGRPDLGGHVEEWALDLHRTLTGRLAALGDDVVVLPAHYQSRSERNADGGYTARLGDLRTHAEFTANVDQFLADVLAGTRPAPAEYGRIRKVNLGVERADAEALDELEIGKNQCAAGGATAG